jgi:hypothetical protein
VQPSTGVYYFFDSKASSINPSLGHMLDAKYGLLPQKIKDSTHLLASKKTYNIPKKTYFLECRLNRQTYSFNL